MKAFADLYTALDETTKTRAKVNAMAAYFRSAPPRDAAWAIYFLIGRKPRQVVPTRKLGAWAASLSQTPEWLFDECYQAVGDLAETITLLLPPATMSSAAPLHEWVEKRLLPLRGADEDSQRDAVLAAWHSLDDRQRFVWNKLITGAFRVGVSQLLVTRAIALASGVEPRAISHRLMGEWSPTGEFFERLCAREADDADVSRPYPFFLAHPLDGSPETLGSPGDWQVEWKWDGIRAQFIRRRGRTFVWSRGEELVTERYPELTNVGMFVPDGTVVDGEILPWRDGKPLPFAQLQRRIGRKTLGKKLLAEVPIVLMAYDLLEHEGADMREKNLCERRGRLAEVVRTVASDHLLLSPMLQADSWDRLANERSKSRGRHVEGLMLKRLDSPYRVGRVRGDWWKWKIEPFTVDAVLIYAQRGHGKRASLYTDYTFGVWDDGRLVPFAKAYSGLTDDEIRQVDAFIRRNTTEKFGPVRTVTPQLVFELAFEAIQPSSRHKSGIAVRFPRILRWRTDKRIEDADTLASVRALASVPKA
jgi:DNA ligase-1